MFLDIDDARLHVVSFGAGPRTFVAHGGWTGSWELWEPPFEALSRSMRCVAWDHRGTGATVAPVASISPARLVADLFAVLDRLGTERCVLAGESMGAVVALLAVAERPERFDGLVLVSGAAMVTPEATGALVAGARVNYPATARAFVDACVPEPDSEHIRRWGRAILARSEAEAAARLFETAWGVRPDLSRVRCPTLLLHGEADAIVPLAAARALAAALPDATLHVLPGAGHVPTMTRTTEVVEHIEAWLARLPA